MAEKVKYEEGQAYIIDANRANGGEVVLVKSYGKHFCLVRDVETGAEWETMLNRLSKKSNDSNSPK